MVSINSNTKGTFLLLIAGFLRGSTAVAETVCGTEGLQILGTNSWEKVSAKVDATVDAQCMYTLEIQFKHAPSLPVPTDPSTQCNPTLMPPVLASDGLPYYASRWFYEKVPEYVKAATDIDHISFDFAPCGHPPIGIFTAPHYDIHTYRVTPEYRTCMTCDLLPGTPVCNFPQNETDSIPQSSASGLAFFAPLDEQNFPVGFVYLKTDNLPYMGGHAANPAHLPVDAASWTEPVLIVGPYNSSNLYYEPMIPLVFMVGENDTHFEANITYVNPTIENLPIAWQVHHEGSNGVVTVTMSGKSSVCQDEFNELKLGGSDTSNASGFPHKSVVLIVLASITTFLVVK